MNLPHIEFDLKNFVLSEDGKTLIGESSEMENRHLQPVDKNYNRGFSVRFDNGDVVAFILTDTKLFTDDDGICCWYFKPTLESIEKYPQYVTYKVTVFND